MIESILVNIEENMFACWRLFIVVLVGYLHLCILALCAFEVYYFVARHWSNHVRIPFIVSKKYSLAASDFF